MKACSLLLFYVTLAQLGYCAETNALSPEMVAQIEQRLHQLSVGDISHWVTNAQYHNGKVLVMVVVSGAHDSGAGWEVTEDGKRREFLHTGVSAKLPEPIKDLTADELRGLRAALVELPVAKTASTANLTAIIGFRSGTNWLGRIYNGEAEVAGLKSLRRFLERPPRDPGWKE